LFGAINSFLQDIFIGRNPCELGEKFAEIVNAEIEFDCDRIQTQFLMKMVLDVGNPDSGIPPGTAFEDIPDDWHCSICCATKKMFTPHLESGFSKTYNLIEQDDLK
jgi:rubredoxin